MLWKDSRIDVTELHVRKMTLKYGEKEHSLERSGIHITSQLSIKFSFYFEKSK